MKIVIEAETPEELKQVAEPIVYAGVQRFAIAGRKEPSANSEFEFGHLHGPWPQLKADISRLTIDCEAQAQHQAIVGAVLQARSVVANQMAIEHATRDVIAKRNGNGRIIH